MFVNRVELFDKVRFVVNMKKKYQPVFVAILYVLNVAINEGEGKAASDVTQDV